MPYTLKTNQISVKDPVTGEYSGVDVFTEQTEQGLIAELQATGTAQVNRINQAAVDVQAAVDQAESDAAQIISETQSAVNTLEIEKNTIAATVASMAELGTDTTLSTPGMAADAAKVGELNNALEEKTGFVLYNLFDTDNDFYENERTNVTAMSAAGVTTRTASTNIVTNDAILLIPGTYYVRVPYTSIGSLLTWKAGSYPVSCTQVSMSTLGVTRTMADGTALFEYTLTLSDAAWFLVNAQIASGNYKTICLLSTVNVLGSDVVVPFGKYSFVDVSLDNVDLAPTMKNITDPITTGVCYNNTTGAASTAFADAATTAQYIPIDNNFDYYYSGKVVNYAGGVSFYDSSKTFLESQFNVSNTYSKQKIVFPANAVFFNASTQNNSTGKLVLERIAKESKTFGETISDLEDAIDDLSKETIVVNHLYVATTGNDTTGDGTQSNPYATIWKANDSIFDNTENNRYVIHVADGTYTDLQTRYAGTDPDGKYQGIVTKNYVSYVGNVNNPGACKLVWDGANGYDVSTFTYEDTGFYKCIFHVNSGCVTKISGFMLESTNTRYCLHIEMAGYGMGADWEVSDCIFVWHGLPDCTDKTSDSPVIGTGSGNFEKGHLCRCKIDNQSNSPDGWMNHDSQDRYPNAAFSEGANIIIEACDFDGTSITWRNMYGDTVVDGYDRFSIIDCIGINSLTYRLGGSSTVCLWRAEIKCSDITSNRFADEDLLQ